MKKVAHVPLHFNEQIALSMKADMPNKKFATNVLGSSNFAIFMEGLGSGDVSWIDGINEVLEE